MTLVCTSGVVLDLGSNGATGYWRYSTGFASQYAALSVHLGKILYKGQSN